MLREELRTALDERLGEMTEFGVPQWSVRAPASDVARVRPNVVNSKRGTSD